MVRQKKKKIRPLIKFLIIFCKIIQAIVENIKIIVKLFFFCGYLFTLHYNVIISYSHRDSLIHFFTEPSLICK